MDQTEPLVLLVEDEAILALTLEMELQDEGFDVAVAGHGVEALERLEQEGSRIAALVTDIRLPQVDGWAIAKRARELMPFIPVVYMSGDSAANWKANGVVDSVMLGKPFVLHDLKDALERATAASNLRSSGLAQ